MFMFTMIIIPSWLLTPLVFILMLCLFVFTLRFINRSSSMLIVPKLPPSPPKLPIIENLHLLVGKFRHQTLCQLSEKYGPVMLIHIGIKPILVISSPAMAKQVLKTHDHVFCSRPTTKATKRLSYNYLDISLSPYDNHWREMRKILVSEFLGAKRTKLFNQVLVTEIGNMVSSLSSNVVVNLNELFFAIVKGVVFQVAFGGEPPLNGVSWDVLLSETMEILNGSVGDSFPWLGRLIDQFSGWNGRLEKCFSTLDAFIEKIIDEHHNHNHTISDEDKDFIHTLLELSTFENASSYRLTKEDVKALIMDVLLGGIGTTVTTMVWAMSEITRNARVMQKLQTEIRMCAESNHQVDITKLTYLKMVVKETLRLHPPIPLLLPHESQTHSKIGDYYVFPGTTVLINGWAIGRDPDTWGENAAEFFPERFEERDVEIGGASYDMVPFGGGRRSCPGMKTAPITVELMIANLLYWFDWEAPNGFKNVDLDMQEEGTLIVRKKLPLCLVPTKHNHKD